ncbi:hypothetical protein ACEN9J_03090 [Variovorax sp. Varisp41]|uniref:hypothetical protein n=1 Tax=Variovorax sp. Varisp41 TaxID=3243033 RepID=UPI0039B4CDE8
MKVSVFDSKTGKEKVMAPRYARIFEAMGRGRYLTRDMVAAPVAPAAPPPAAAPAPAPAPVAPVAPVAAAPTAPAGEYVVKVDGADVVLDSLDAVALHELAKKLDVKVHHASGAEKVRAAIMDAKGSAAE